MDSHTSTDNHWNLLNNGIHICSIYRNNDELFTSIIPFFSEGLVKNQKCMYIYDENNPQDITKELEKAWEASGKLKQSSAMQIISQHETYTKDGVFNPDQMIAHVDKFIDDSLGEGYVGLRAAAEMSWMVNNHTPAEVIIEYELKLNTVYPTRKLIGICQYHEDSFSKDVLINIIRTHPYVMIYGKLYQNKYLYTNPQYTLGLNDHFKASDYDTILSMFLDEIPFGSMN